MESDITSLFQAISLEQMEKVRFLNRIDRKFCLPKEILSDLLLQIRHHYYVLEIFGFERQLYHTIYYDTPENSMYLAHHNGKLNRYKIRKRSYVLSDSTFLEIKFKNNKGRTIKKRMATLNRNATLNPLEQHFIVQHTPFDPLLIRPVLENQFKRITLVNRSFNERCTIDTDLTFFRPEREKKISDLVIIEIKADGRLNTSPLYQALKEHHIQETGFSKYCIGRALLERTLKQNNFKIKLRNIERFNTGQPLMKNLYAIGG